MGHTPDQIGCLQTLHQRRHRGGMHLEPLTDLAQRQRTAAREGQQDQDLVARKSQTQGAKQLIELGEEQLMNSHQRSHSPHSVHLTPLRGPLFGRLLDRVERQPMALQGIHVPSSSSAVTTGWGTSPSMTMRSTSSRWSMSLTKVITFRPWTCAADSKTKSP